MADPVVPASTCEFQVGMKVTPKWELPTVVYTITEVRPLALVIRYKDTGHHLTVRFDEVNIIKQGQVEKEEHVSSSTGGKKDMKGKAPMSYLPLDLCAGAASVLAANAKENGGKYEADNFRKGVGVNTAIGSILRHLIKIQEASRNGDKDCLDAESGISHVHHIVADALILVAAMQVEGFKV